jgi:hypothetical protein
MCCRNRWWIFFQIIQLNQLKEYFNLVNCFYFTRFCTNNSTGFDRFCRSLIPSFTKFDDVLASFIAAVQTKLNIRNRKFEEKIDLRAQT